MKTTIDLSDALFDSAKELARQRQITMRALVEEGLCRVLADAWPAAKTAFKLRDASVHGKQALIAEPRRWREMEEEHIAARVAQARA